ncbi:hypothetical protein BU24DRAFT_406026 [Aaosphaeria arxii CBS 175.79]|uniref:BZIP domain-containing protein n=1 Tax=Aaosphaeria arxii CBS 175.79 TaxID=1450172 RepID=A0A6A5Y4A8_9PLEO|nr:uncharacterized protein BU24DRAFT_406026 [Aaosphaeria arxii CBS 175.79]KAF2019344.1 hypothetical protein BU24DRAFT_406026 [Aaosphaeria arxii CBS 175.79]
MPSPYSLPLSVADAGSHSFNPSPPESIYGTSMSQTINKASTDLSPSYGSSPSSPKNQSPSTDGSLSTPKLSKSQHVSNPNESTARIEKRRQNTLAARRYRQKRVDQVSTLESALKDTQSERDDLKVRVARLEGEVETLRALLRSNK